MQSEAGSWWFGCGGGFLAVQRGSTLFEPRDAFFVLLEFVFDADKPGEHLIETPVHFRAQIVNTLTHVIKTSSEVVKAFAEIVEAFVLYPGCDPDRAHEGEH